MGQNQRSGIRMTEDEIRNFLNERHTMSMATVGPDGDIHLVAMWYGFVDGCVAFETKAKSQKVKNLRRDPRITILIESGDSYDQLRGVEIVGTAELVEGEDLRAIAGSVLTRYVLTDTTHLEAAVDAAVHKRVGIMVRPRRVVSWDHTKMA